jgi:pyridoxamine 5'-phosphate oxidase
MTAIDAKELASLRRDYSGRELSRRSVADTPFGQFAEWFNEALAAMVPEANAMVLGTVSSAGEPSGRTVLLKGFSEEGFTFFTNYRSAKARDLEAEGRCFLLFFWKELERQVLVKGVAERVPEEASDEYFASRPYESQIGAVASEQSAVVDSRLQLEARFAELERQFAGSTVPRPPHWGGYLVRPRYFEFWQGRPSRLHDRICFERDGDSWKIFRLSP